MSWFVIFTTKKCFWGSNTTNHLPSWVSKSSQNLTDATTGATRNASTSLSDFGSKSITWGGKYLESSYYNKKNCKY